jgi:hypothetical protein
MLYGILISSGLLFSACGKDMDRAAPQLHIEGVDGGGEFRITNPRIVECRPSSGSGPGELVPEMDELVEIANENGEEFIVVMKHEILEEEFPFPSGDLPNAGEAAQARAEEIAESQACAISAVQDVGGVYLRSFMIINAFTAIMTAEQALLTSKHDDVWRVELGRTETPPP